MGRSSKNAGDLHDLEAATLRQPRVIHPPASFLAAHNELVIDIRADAGRRAGVLRCRRSDGDVVVL
jgi:hypothetical protein